LRAAWLLRVQTNEKKVAMSTNMRERCFFGGIGDWLAPEHKKSQPMTTWRERKLEEEEDLKKKKKT